MASALAMLCAPTISATARGVSAGLRRTNCITVDLKTTRFAAPRAFARDAVEKDYGLQELMYSFARGLFEGSTAPRPFVFVAAESAAPYSVRTLVTSDTFIGNGSLKFHACVAAFKPCTDIGYWPDLSTDGSVDLDPWQQFNSQADSLAASSAGTQVVGFPSAVMFRHRLS